MTDRCVLERIKDRTLRICPRGRFVESKTNRGKKRLRIIRRKRHGSEYRFVSICANGKKKKVSVHRLVWMSKHLQLVPDGFDIDHKHGRKIKFPDAIGNLRLLPSSVNRSNKLRLIPNRESRDFVRSQAEY